ncbi:MAG: MerR family transcriptional regulator [Proteobacteria bacterium]|nr:MerR family transcriptional regulator [Pseudomonadota bacterium]
MRIDPEKPLFPISTVAEILECPQKVLRLYEKSGLVIPARSDGQRRLYSQRDVEKLEVIHYLTHVRKVNIAGVQVILELLPHLAEDGWQRIVHRVEQAVENLPEDQKELMERGSEEVVAALEEEPTPAIGNGLVVIEK